VLVVGVGFFGEKLFRTLSAADIEVQGTMPTEINGFSKLDITSKDDIESVFSDSMPEIVVHTAAISNVDYCEQHKDEAFNVNVAGTKNIAEACKKNNAKLVFLSTDYVFDGKKGNYAEDDKTNPIQYYGATKLLGEQEALKLSEALVLRTSSLYGYNSANDRQCFPVFVLNQLRQGKEVTAALQVTCPTLIDDLANALLQLLELNASGIFHAVGSDAMTRFDVAKIVAELFELDDGLIKKASDLHLAAKRPQNSSLSIKKLSSSGIEAHGVVQGLEIMKKQMEE